MKKKLLLVILFFVNISAFQGRAQSLIIQGGFSLSEIKEKYEGGITLDSDMKPGFHGGILAELPASKWLSFVPGLIYSNKGAKVNQNFFGAEIKGSINLHYLEVPLIAKVSGNLENKGKVFFMLGPYLGMGLAGKVKGEGENDQGNIEKYSEKVSWGNTEEDYVKRLDFGATAGAGVEIKNCLISIQYDYGIANIAANTDGATVNNRVLRLSLGYRLGKH